MSDQVLALLMFIGMVVGIFAGYRIAFVIGGVAVVFSLIGKGPTILNILGPRIMAVMGNYTLEAVPLFIFMGVMLQISGVSEKLFESMHLWLGALRGGLAVTTVLICTLLAAASGIVGATETTMGLVALPAMIKKGYNKSLAAGVILAGGALGIIIPPSIMLVVLGPTTGLSVIDLYLAAFIPGILLAVMYVIFILLTCYIKPEWGPALPKEERNVPVRKLITDTIHFLIPPIALIMLCLGTVVLGVASPTEAAGLGALGAVIIAGINQKLNWKLLRDSFYKTLCITSMVLMIAVGGGIFSSVFSAYGGSNIVVGLMQYIPGGKWGIFIVINLMLIFAGMLLDWIAIVMIMIPIIMAINKVLGFDPLWLVTFIAVNLQMSFLSPPFAYAIFYLRAIAPPEVTTADIYKGAFMFMPLQACVVLMCVFFPQVILWLPTLSASLK